MDDQLDGARGEWHVALRIWHVWGEKTHTHTHTHIYIYIYEVFWGNLKERHSLEDLMVDGRKILKLILNR